MQSQFKQGRTVSKLLQQAMAALACSAVLASPSFAAADQMLIRVRTFVHQGSYLVNPLACGGAVSVAGDGRGTQPTGGSSRTFITLMREFKTAGGVASSVRTTSKTAGLTKGFDIWGNLVTSGTASTSGMVISTVSTGAGSTTWQLAHAMGNPICTDAIPMDYNLSVKVTSGHAVTVTGTHEIYPDLEIYASKNAGASWTKVYHSVGDNILCLLSDLPGCAKKPVNVTKQL